MTDTYIIANDRVECLFIPRSQFVKKGNMKILEKLKDDLNACIPSNEEAFKTYISDNRWNKYKRSVIQVSFTNFSTKPLNNSTELEGLLKGQYFFLIRIYRSRFTGQMTY